MARAAQDLGVCRSLLGKWKQQLADETQQGLRTFPGSWFLILVPGPGPPADEELTRLRREVQVLREERDI